MTKILKYPFGKADAKSVVFDFDNNVGSLSVQSNETVADLGVMTDDATLNLDIGSEVEPGDTLTMKVGADGVDDADPSRTLTLGTGLTGKAQTIVATVHYLMKFKYDGAKFVHLKTQQISASPPAH